MLFPVNKSDQYSYLNFAHLRKIPGKISVFNNHFINAFIESILNALIYEQITKSQSENVYIMLYLSVSEAHILSIKSTNQ